MWVQNNETQDNTWCQEVTLDIKFRKAMIKNASSDFNSRTGHDKACDSLRTLFRTNDFFVPWKPVIAVIFKMDFVIFTALLDSSHDLPANRASLESMQLMISDIYSLCPAAVLVPKLSACIVCLCVCILEMAASVIIRVILKLETVLETGMSFEGWISPVYWLPSLLIRQNISSTCHGWRGSLSGVIATDKLGVMPWKRSLGNCENTPLSSWTSTLLVSLLPYPHLLLFSHERSYNRCGY